MPIYTYTTLDDPLATGGLGSEAFSINDAGQIVGSFQNDSGVHGFLKSGSTYTTLDDPLATGDTFAFGINATGQIVGHYTNSTGTHGFLYDPNSNIFPPYFTLDFPSQFAEGTFALGINATGQIVGYS